MNLVQKHVVLTCYYDDQVGRKVAKEKVVVVVDVDEVCVELILALA